MWKTPAQTAEFPDLGLHDHTPEIFLQMYGPPSTLYVQSHFTVAVVPSIYFPSNAGGFYVIWPLSTFKVPHTPMKKSTLMYTKH